VSDEASRNSRLRRVDLRFAAGVPAPSCVAVGAADDLLRAGLQVVGAQVVPLEASRPGTCDLLVLTSFPRRTTLDKGWLALRPAGGCWIESRASPHRSPEAIAQMLSRRGFTALETFAPWPSAARPRLWVPLDRFGRVATACLPRHEGRSTVRRLLHDLRVVLWRVRLALRLAPAVAIVARRPLEASAADNEPRERRVLNFRAALDELVQAAWSSSEAQVPPGRLTWCFATGGAHSSNKIVATVSSRPSTAARLVVKLPRLRASAEGLAREADVLEALAPLALPGVPRLLGRQAFEGGLAVVESRLEGRPLPGLLGSAPIDTLAAHVREWLQRLARRQGAASGRANSVARAFADRSDRIRDRPAADGRAWATALARLPSVVEHRDFGPWNLLLHRSGDIQVLDWESALLDGIPGADLVYFLTYLEIFTAGARTPDDQVAVCKRVWHSGGSSAQTAPRQLEVYLRDLGQQPDLARAIRLYTWASHAVAADERQHADPGGDARRAAEFFTRMWEAEADARC
jgi:hypothetical protein